MYDCTMPAKQNIVHTASCLEILDHVPIASVDAVVTDPPYEIGVGGVAWDKTGIALDSRVWLACFEVMKPGAMLVCFTAPRMYHRIASTIEGVGFEIIDMLVWQHGGGMVRGQSTSRQIDAYQIYGATNSRALRAVADEHGVGTTIVKGTNNGMFGDDYERSTGVYQPISEEAKRYVGYGSRLRPQHEPMVLARKPMAGSIAQNVLEHGVGSLRIGEGSRAGNILSFSKPSASERVYNPHKTAKPIGLMSAIIRLVMPPVSGVVLDPFSGGGTTSVAAKILGHGSIAFEIDEKYAELSRKWINNES